MTIAAMWSGGKDSSLAVWRALKSGVEVEKLICMIHKGKARAHGIDVGTIRAQERAIGIEIFVEETTWGSYEERLKRILREINAEKVIFGDIYLQEHRDWIERVCSEAGVEPIFPLWGDDTFNLAMEFIDAGFEAYIIAVKKDVMPKDFLGRKFDSDFVNYAVKNGIDPCGEDGEFHTYVAYGPFFKKRVEFSFGEVFESDRYLHLKVKI